ncbi:response regulator transcription factor [Marinibacterium profundimaris]|uniref:Response regulatory domain-containing protein n=1 Tax=Marinibacterium profundimaris TaxID=1679460 RepID=A0A225NHB6_9RHOB|nr:response regulator [Marinibacterium profundimaris]OWU73242.1 hypothetical protein ATO3_11080 [Marinibacterium profundimaris]
MVSATSLIAIVDDDTSFRTALESFARSLGYRARGFASAEDFLGSDAVRDADCIVSDIHMSGMSGIDLKHRLDAQGSTTAVILVTGHTEPGTWKQARACHPHCFLLKPFDPQQMTECLAAATGA